MRIPYAALTLTIAFTLLPALAACHGAPTMTPPSQSLRTATASPLPTTAPVASPATPVPAVATTALVGKDPAAGWKMYTGFGVTFRYPGAWTLGGVRSDPSNGRNGDAVFEAGNGYEVHLNAYDDPDNLDYAELMTAIHPSLSAQYTSAVLEPVATVGGVLFQRVRAPQEQSTDIVFRHSGRLYVLASGSAVPGGEGEDPLNASLTELLATFRFTD